MNPDAELIYFDSPGQWRNWLAMHGKDTAEVWLGFYKKNSKQTGITYIESVNEALCYGWIDGLTKRVDDDSYKVRFTPRKLKSNWSPYNIERVETLIKDGKMTPAGMVYVDAAKADGRWEVSNS